MVLGAQVCMTYWLQKHNRGIWERTNVTPCCHLKRGTEKSQERVSDLAPRQEWDPDLLPLLHPVHNCSIGITMKNGFRSYQKPLSCPCTSSALFCQCDPCMRTDPVISGQGASYSFTVIMKAETPNSRAAVVQAQGLCDTIIACQMLGECGVGSRVTLPRDSPLAMCPGVTMASWKEPLLALSTYWPRAVSLAPVSSPDTWE